MNPPNPVPQNSRFGVFLVIAAVLWLALGCVLYLSRPADLIGFIQIFIFTFLDLVFLILIFKTVFFVPPTHGGRKMQILLFVFFKLVCLGFLAITLKRLRNAPISVILMGVEFIWIGPLIAGLLTRWRSRRMS